MTTCRAPRAAPRRCSATAAALPSFSIATGTPKRSLEPVAQIDVLRAGCSPMSPRGPTAGRSSTGRPRRAPRTRPSARPPMTRSSCVEDGLLAARVGRLDRATNDRPVPIDEPRGQLRPAQVDRDHLGSAHSGSGYDTRSLWRRKTSRTGSTAADGSRAPFRPSRGRGESRAPGGGDGRDAYARPKPTRQRRRRRWLRIGLVVVLVVVLAVAVWARARLPRLPQRREGGERAPRLAGLRGARAAGRAHPLEPVDDPRARHRRGPGPRRGPSAPTRS